MKIPLLWNIVANCEHIQLKLEFLEDPQCVLGPNSQAISTISAPTSIFGFYDETAQNLTFARFTSLCIPNSIEQPLQVFTGYLMSDTTGQICGLAGSFESFVKAWPTPGTCQRNVFGWNAIM